MALVTLRDVSLDFNAAPIFDGVFLSIEDGERVALVGRNGAGKSTLLRAIARETPIDDGEIVYRQGVRIARLRQDLPSDMNGSVDEIVRGEIGDAEQHEAEAVIDRLFRQLRLEPSRSFAELSTGTQRRVLLARALASRPDLLLLDEPTNHLDVDSILALEEMLASTDVAMVFVTHDRAFLRRLATRIVDLDRGKLQSYECDFDTFLERRQSVLDAEDKQRALFDKKLAEEEVWVRKGTKAQRTRGVARITRLEKMREDKATMRQRVGVMKAEVQEAEKSGRRVVEVKGLGFSFEGRAIVRDFDLAVMRGDKIGIIGPNGCGKTTLVRLLLGDLAPGAGTIRQGTNLEIAYFDQTHAILEDEKTVRENVADGHDIVELESGTRHVISYLERFLFTARQAKLQVKSLSGGERNRLLLAKLFAKKFNVLVMDEPTNDLDIETLELLEEILVDFSGTLLLVSHDREFVNNVVTSTLVFEGDGKVKEYAGGYDDWQRCRREASTAVANPKPKATSAPADTRPEKPKAKKLSFKEERELESLPARIEALETVIQNLEAELSSPEFYKRPGAEIAASTSRLESLRAELDAAITRWTELEDRRA